MGHFHLLVLVAVTFGSPSLEGAVFRQDVEEDRVAYQGYRCDTNEYDEDQWCLCESGQRITRMKSWHSNRKEDRQWELTCETLDLDQVFEPTPYSTSQYYYTTNENDWDGHVEWDGTSDHSFLVGMESEHDGRKEDRKFKFKTARSDVWELTSCSNWNQINEYDDEMNFNIGDDEVIAGLKSDHDNRKEDREWYAKTCKLTHKCGTEGSLTIDLSQAIVKEEKTEYAIFDTIDASGSTSKITKTNSLTQTTVDGMSSTETFSRTSGYTFEAGFSLTQEAGIDIEIISTGSSYTYEASLTTEYITEFARSKTTSYSESSSSVSSWNMECSAGYICESSVKITTASVTAPYTIVAGSCTEEGTVTITNAFTGSLVKNDHRP